MPQKLAAQAEQILSAFKMAERNYRPEALGEERKKAVRKLNDLLKQNTQYQSAYKDEKQAELKAAREKLDVIEGEVKVFSIFKNGKVDYEALNKVETLKKYFSDQLKQLPDKKAIEAALAEIAEVNDVNVVQAFKMAISKTPPAFFYEKEREYYSNPNVFATGVTPQNIVWLKDTVKQLDDMQLGITHPDIKVARANFNLAKELFSGALSGKSEIGDKITAIRSKIEVFGENYDRKPGEDFF